MVVVAVGCEFERSATQRQRHHCASSEGGCGWVRLGGLVRLGAGCRERCGKCGGPRVHGAYRGAESDVGGIVLAALLHGAVAADWHHAHHHTPPCTHRHAHTVMHLITYY